MKDENKNQTPSLLSNNPFLAKPLKKVNNLNSSPTKPPQSSKDINKINEHRASKFINIQSNLKNLKNINDKKPPESQKNLISANQKEINIINNNDNISQEENKSRNGKSEGIKNILKTFNDNQKNKVTSNKTKENKIHKKRVSIERFINPKIEENFKKENEIISQKNYNTNNSDQGDENKEKKEIQKIQVTIKESLFKKGENNKKDNENTPYINNLNRNNNDNIINMPEKIENIISFKNDEEILEYIKCKVRDGKIQNIYEKLELKNNDYSGFSLTKKDKGYTIHEIKIEDDIKKINEEIKSQKIEINNKPVQLIYTDELESLINIKKEYACLKEITYINVKDDYEKSTGTVLPKDKPKNKSIENKSVKFEKNIENKNNKINSYNISVEVNFKSKKKENEIKEKLVPVAAKKPEDENKFAGLGIIPEINDKKAKEIQSQKRVSKAYNRFKKAFSLHKDKENEKNTGNSDKIHSLASMLQEHIIKPLSEIQEENEGGHKMYRGGSVETRQSKIYDNNIMKILESAPVTKKHVKKPKFSNFVNN